MKLMYLNLATKQAFKKKTTKKTPAETLGFFYNMMDDFIDIRVQSSLGG